MAASAMLFACHTPARAEESEGESTKNQEAVQVSEKPGQTKALKHVFTATHAGTWYPGDKKGLQALLTKFFDQALGTIKRPDLSAFMEHRQITGDTICGFFPISILLAMLPQDTTVEPLHFDTSGRITDNYTNSVSYFSIAFFQDTKGAMIQQTTFINKKREMGLLK